MAKKVIFIGSLRYSGSTLLDLILGNDPAGFSVGEISTFFKSKIRPQCSCDQSPCPTWQTIEKQGIKNCYNTIFEAYPESRFIVDSSKSPIWIRKMQAVAAKQGHQTTNVLIWKSPYDSATSYNKRGKLDQWTKEWIHYHRLYLSVVSDFIAINHRDFVNNPLALENICKFTGVEFFEGKRNYWDKQHHSVGGNGSTKIHLFDKTSDRFDNVNEFMKKRSNDHELKDKHRSLYASEAPREVKEFVDSEMRKNPIIEQLTSILSTYDAIEPAPAANSSVKPIALYGKSYVAMRALISDLKLKLTGN